MRLILNCAGRWTKYERRILGIYDCSAKILIAEGINKNGEIVDSQRPNNRV